MKQKHITENLIDVIKSIGSYIFILLVASLGVITVSTLIYIYYDIYFNFHEKYSKVYEISDTAEKNILEILGSAGDFVGGIFNPAISGVTIFALFYTIYLQKKELNENKEIIEKQSKEIKKQNFENTYFKLIENYQNILSELESKNIITRNPSFLPEDQEEYSTGSLIGYEENYLKFIHKKTRNLKLEGARRELSKENSLHKSHFLFLYQILKLIFTHGDTGQERKFSNKKEFNSAIAELQVSEEERIYSNIIRSIIKENIMTLLAVICAVTDENDQFYTYRLLVERYSLLAHFESHEKSKSALSTLEKEIFEFFHSKAFDDNEAYRIYKKMKSK